VAVSGSAPRRYAEALLELAEDPRAVGQFRASLERLAPVFDRVTVAGLRDPSISLSQRAEALAAGLTDEPPAIRAAKRAIRHGWGVSLEAGLDIEDAAWRTAALSADRREGIAQARVTTAVPLDDQGRDDLVRRLERASRTKLRATFAVDPGLIGGAKVQIGDHLIDSSLYGKLIELGRELAS